jgi:hypothetical protein
MSTFFLPTFRSTQLRATGDAIYLPSLARLQSILRHGQQEGMYGPHETESGSRRIDPYWLAEKSVFEERAVQLPYALAGAFNAVERLEIAQAEAVEIVGNRGQLAPDCIVSLDPPSEHAMGFAVDQFFDAVCRAQNAISWYISRQFRTSLSASMHDLITRDFRRWTTCERVPSEIRDVITTYWNDWGKRNKAHRDLAEHHAVISSDVRLSMNANGQPLIYLAIPSNPEEKDSRRRHYDAPVQHAYPYIMEAFAAIFELVDTVATLLLPPGPYSVRFEYVMNFRGTLVIGPPFVGHPILQPGSFGAAFARWRSAREAPPVGSG